MKVLQVVLASMALIFCAHGKMVKVKKSEFSWKGSKITSSHFGKVSLKKGELELGKKGLIKGGSIVIDMNSMTVEDITKKKKAAGFIKHMKSDDFFKVAKFPTAMLKIKKDDGKMISGDMTVLGVTKPVKIPYTKSGNTYQGKFTFDRTKFGIKYGSGSFFSDLGDRAINDEVNLDFILKL